MLGSTPISSDAAPAEPATAPDARLVEHAPNGRLVAQRGLFNGPDPVCPEDLYAKVVHGAAVRERQRLVVRAGSEVTLDTYFGRFPASYWQRWTVVDTVDIEVTATGSGRLAVIASDIEGETRTVAAQDLTGLTGEQVTVTAELDKFVDGGFLWVQFTTTDSELVVDRLRWTVDPPKRLRPTAVVICTYNRADDCTKTLQSLGGDQESLDVLDAIYVVDQGSDTVESRPQFPEIQQALAGRLRYLRQPNLGGAGGFGRGMYEVTGQGGAEHANLLFMDDDVLCEPEIAIRLTAFANRTPSPTIVGGQMLRLLHPTRLLAGAEYADFAQLIPGKVVKNALDDVDLLAEEADEDGAGKASGKGAGKVVRGDLRVDADYNAWWSCLIPAEVVAAIGLPMPLFFQWDDVEYGYRARAKGFPTVTLPGAGLWHADFDWKDLDKWNEYFAVRNAMIVSTLHAEIDPKQTARVLTSRISRYLLAMQYGLAATLIKATEDFLEGPDFLNDGGASAAKSVHALRADYPDTIMHKASDVPGLSVGEIKQIQAGPKPSSNRLTLLKRVAYLAMGRSVHPIGAVSKPDATWWHVSQFETAVVTDGSQGGVRVRRRDRELTIKLAKQAARAVRRLVAEMPRLREEYRAAAPRLTSRENWRRLYDKND
ncbi:glycosyl transferase [Actinophytocola xinjiangensis]|uniref:Glycosyl transferase n=1 Tax=Actinophytocola xinjiangensis TaxID=485602 RepID=A0A7Z0WJH8_9PSEU|nr:glycosyltransferase [Actinophytocola xinjiangensis]OLF07597.1 glycosyl transferase [Actinophytocola xinjiangensis]